MKIVRTCKQKPVPSTSKKQVYQFTYGRINNRNVIFRIFLNLSLYFFFIKRIQKSSEFKKKEFIKYNLKFCVEINYIYIFF